MTQQTDADLHQRILAGDETAMTIWHGRIAPRVRGMLRVKGVSDEDAEEIFDDVFVSSVQRAGRISPLGSGLNRYILGAAWKQIAEYHEGRKDASGTLPLRENDADSDEAAGPRRADPVAAAAAARALPMNTRVSESVQRLRDCLAEARPGVLRLAEMWMQNATEAEIAQDLGIAKTSVRKYVQRMKLALQECIERKETSDGQ